MSKDNLKGGKADKLSVEDIAKKHDVSVDSIKSQIEMGKKIEMEHVDDSELAEEITKDHLDEIPDYYTRLKSMEKEAKKELNLESKRLMALAGIKEGDKKFLTNESFQEPRPVDDVTFRGPIYQRDKKNGNWIDIETGNIKSESKNEKDNDDFIVFELDQKHFEPGQDDDTLYKLG